MPINTDYIVMGAPRPFTADTLPMIQTGSMDEITAAGQRASAAVTEGVQFNQNLRGNEMTLKSRKQQQLLQDNLMKQLGPDATATDAELVKQFQTTLGAQLPMSPDGTIDLKSIREQLAAHVEMKDQLRMRSALTQKDGTSELLRDESIKNGVDIYDSNGLLLPDPVLSKNLATAKQAAAAAKNATGAPKMTEAQARAAGFVTDVLGAEPQIAKVLSEYDPTGKDAGWWENLKLAKDNVLPDSQMDAWVKSDQYNRYKAAVAPWINAVLYQRSGASIQPSEFARGMTAFFPRPGDSADTVANKEVLRKRAAQAMYRLSRNELPTGVTITKAPDGTETFSLSAGDIVLQNRDGGGGGGGGGSTPGSPEAGVSAIKASGEPLLRMPDGKYSWKGKTGTRDEILSFAGGFTVPAALGSGTAAAPPAAPSAAPVPASKADAGAALGKQNPATVPVVPVGMPSFKNPDIEVNQRFANWFLNQFRSTPVD